MRSLLRDRKFTVPAVCALALGIGAAAAVFSVVEAVVIAPFPYAQAGRLVSIFLHDRKDPTQDGRNYFLAPDFLAFAQSGCCEAVFGSHPLDVTMTGTEFPVLLIGALVTGNAFEALGVSPRLGRAIEPADARPGAPPVALLSWDAYRAKLGGNPGLVGRTVVLNGVPTTIIGVMPPRFRWQGKDVWLPTALERGERGDYRRWFVFHARLRPGMTKERAGAMLTAVALRQAPLFPQDYTKNPQVSVRTLAEQLAGPYRTTLWLLLGAVGLLLAIGCANVANLMLARAAAREKEMAVRTALGASRARLVSQVLTESALVALAGGAAGCAAAWAGLPALLAAMPRGTIPAEVEVRLNGIVLAAALGLTFVIAAAFGLAPALRASRMNLRAKGVPGGALAAGEVALALVLLAGAGLLLRTLFALRSVELGFDPDPLLEARVVVPPKEPKARFFGDLLRRVEALPGVVSATEISGLPPLDGIPSAIALDGGRAGTTLLSLVSERYFRTLGVPLVRGRAFTARELAAKRTLAVVNQAFARRYFGAGDPLGRRIKPEFLERVPDPVPEPWLEIVGVAADLKNRGLRDQAAPAIYVPATLMEFAERGIMLRAAGDPRALVGPLRREAREVSAWATLDMVGATRDRLEATSYGYAGPRFRVAIAGIFGAAGLLLALVGVYGVMSYSVSRQRREIGIRLALGAQAADIRRHVMGSGLRLVLAGAAAGVAAAVALARLFEHEVWGVSARDPAALAAAAAVLAVAAAVACWIPARRAMMVDAAEELRQN